MKDVLTELKKLLDELLTKEPTLVIGGATAVVIALLHLVGLDATTADVTSVVAGLLGLLGIRSKVSPA